jgi:hypothetical protein
MCSWGMPYFDAAAAACLSSFYARSGRSFPTSGSAPAHYGALWLSRPRHRRTSRKVQPRNCNIRGRLCDPSAPIPGSLEEHACALSPLYLFCLPSV